MFNSINKRFHYNSIFNSDMLLFYTYNPSTFLQRINYNTLIKTQRNSYEAVIEKYHRLLKEEGSIIKRKDTNVLPIPILMDKKKKSKKKMYQVNDSYDFSVSNYSKDNLLYLDIFEDLKFDFRNKNPFSNQETDLFDLSILDDIYLFMDDIYLNQNVSVKKSNLPQSLKEIFSNLNLFSLNEIRDAFENDLFIDSFRQGYTSRTFTDKFKYKYSSSFNNLTKHIFTNYLRNTNYFFDAYFNDLPNDSLLYLNTLKNVSKKFVHDNFIFKIVIDEFNTLLNNTSLYDTNLIMISKYLDPSINCENRDAFEYLLRNDFNYFNFNLPFYFKKLLTQQLEQKQESYLQFLKNQIKIKIIEHHLNMLLHLKIKYKKYMQTMISSNDLQFRSNFSNLSDEDLFNIYKTTEDVNMNTNVISSFFDVNSFIQKLLFPKEYLFAKYNELDYTKRALKLVRNANYPFRDLYDSVKPMRILF